MSKKYDINKLKSAWSTDASDDVLNNDALSESTDTSEDVRFTLFIRSYGRRAYLQHRKQKIARHRLQHPHRLKKFRHCLHHRTLWT